MRSKSLHGIIEGIRIKNKSRIYINSPGNTGKIEILLLQKVVTRLGHIYYLKN